MMIKDLEMNEDLTTAELSGVSGGMKWERNTANPDVIDARGGQVKFGWVTISFDKNGQVSDVS